MIETDIIFKLGLTSYPPHTESPWPLPSTISNKLAPSSSPIPEISNVRPMLTSIDSLNDLDDVAIDVYKPQVMVAA